MSMLFNLKNLILPQSDKLRENWVAGKLKEIKKESKILDAGAGECYYKRYCNNLEYVSQDFGKYNGEGDGSGIQTGSRDSSKIDIVSDIVSIPVKSESFDALLCVEVFEHIPRPLDALKELSRIIKKGGILILTAPSLSLTHYSPYYFYSGFSKNFYLENLPRYGFEIKEVYVYGNYFDFLSTELARVPLVFFRKNKLLFIPVSILYIFVLPTYILFRIFSFLLPTSQELLCFGIGVKAIKK